MSTKFFTNKNNNNLINKFKGVFENQSIHHFDALVGYFRTKFFVFDTISFNKLKYIEQKMVDENDYVDRLIDELQRIYKKIIKLHNNKKKSARRGKSHSVLVVTKRTKSQVKDALNLKSELEITNAFTPYIDEILNENLTIRKILPYFFTFKNDEYEIIDTYLEFHNLHYGYCKN